MARFCEKSQKLVAPDPHGLWQCMVGKEMEKKFLVMEYGRCRNGMENFKTGMEDNLSYFYTNSILDFAHGIYRKIIKDRDN